MLLYLFKDPIDPDTLITGETSTSICTWSGHSSAVILFTPFHLHISLNIAPISHLFSISLTIKMVTQQFEQCIRHQNYDTLLTL